MLKLRGSVTGAEAFLSLVVAIVVFVVANALNGTL